MGGREGGCWVGGLVDSRGSWKFSACCVWSAVGCILLVTSFACYGCIHVYVDSNGVILYLPLTSAVHYDIISTSSPIPIMFLRCCTLTPHQSVSPPSSGVELKEITMF